MLVRVEARDHRREARPAEARRHVAALVDQAARCQRVEVRGAHRRVAVGAQAVEAVLVALDDEERALRQADDATREAVDGRRNGHDAVRTRRFCGAYRDGRAEGKAGNPQGTVVPAGAQPIDGRQRIDLLAGLTLQPFYRFRHQPLELVIVHVVHLRWRLEQPLLQSFDRVQRVVPDRNDLETERCHIITQAIADQFVEVHTTFGGVLFAFGKHIGNAAESLQVGRDAEVIQ